MCYGEIVLSLAFLSLLLLMHLLKSRSASAVVVHVDLRFLLTFAELSPAQDWQPAFAVVRPEHLIILADVLKSVPQMLLEDFIADLLLTR